MSNGGRGPTNRGHDGADDDDSGPASRGRDVTCGGRTPNFNAVRRGKPAEQRGRPAECMVSCPPAC